MENNGFFFIKFLEIFLDDFYEKFYGYPSKSIIRSYLRAIKVGISPNDTNEDIEFKITGITQNMLKKHQSKLKKTDTLINK